MKQLVQTDAAPKAIGTYSQAVKVGNTVYLSGQIALHPDTMELIDGSIEEQIRRVIDNIKAVVQEANGRLDDIVKLTVYLTDLEYFPIVNQVMEEYFTKPYPARAAVGVATLPKDAQVEIDAIMVICEDYTF